MYFAHFGLAIFIIGASVSESNKIEKEFTLEIGETKKVGVFDYRFQNLKEFKSTNYDAVIASIIVSKGDDSLQKLIQKKAISLK